jgi:hypothetical protein
VIVFADETLTEVAPPWANLGASSMSAWVIFRRKSMSDGSPLSPKLGTQVGHRLEVDSVPKADSCNAAMLPNGFRASLHGSNPEPRMSALGQKRTCGQA